MSTLRTVGAAVLAANFSVANASGAQCVNRDELSALRTAAMQQELMVAALTCHDIGRYNNFVLANRAELIDSDARLKAFFIHGDARGGEAGYHTFKTELANSASLRSVRHPETFCANANAAFELATRRMSLAAFVAARPLALAVSYRPCAGEGGSTPLTVEAAAVPPPRQAEFTRNDAGVEISRRGMGADRRVYDRDPTNLGGSDTWSDDDGDEDNDGESDAR